MLAGTVTTGGVVSPTVTVNEALPVLLCASVAEQVTVVVPIAKVEPEAGKQVEVNAPSTMSAADDVKLTTAPNEPAASLEMLAGTVTSGEVVSTTVIVKVALPVLLCASVAEQVTLVVPIAKVEPEAGEQVGVIAPSTMSVADDVKLTAAPDEPVASFVILAGTVTTGAVVSTTVTVKVLLPVLPAKSVAEHVTVVVPIAKVEPEAGEQAVVIAPSTMSVADDVKVAVAPAEEVPSTVMFAGTVTTGEVVSLTVTAKVLLPVLPATSVAEQVTVVVPIAKVEPEAGEQVEANTPSTLSVADDVKVAVAPVELVASVVMLAGTVTTGAVVSPTVTVKVLLPVLPAASVAEQVTVVVPIAKVEPDAGKQVGVDTPLVVSVADAVKLITAPAELVASAVMLAGTMTTGLVLSILILFALTIVLTFPALSVQVPDADCPDPSVLKVTGAVQDATPDPASVPLKLTTTFVLFQPFAFGAGVALADADGATLSICTVTTLLAALTFPALSVAVCAVDGPEAVKS
jgi:hypothetical protein